MMTEQHEQQYYDDRHRLLHQMTISTEGSSWHATNRGLSQYIAIYLTLFLVILVFSVRSLVCAGSSVIFFLHVDSTFSTVHLFFH
jgi:hypothetical protein